MLASGLHNPEGMEPQGLRRIPARRCSALGRILTAATLAATALLGCTGSAVNRGAEFYLQGRYIDADQVFEHTEPALLQLEVPERARYALYRGANYLALGDPLGAQRWLGYGARLGGSTLSALSSQDQQLLRDSLSALRSRAAWGAAASSTGAAGVGLAARALRLGP